MLKKHGLLTDLIHDVDCDSEDIVNVVPLPTIEICGQTINRASTRGHTQSCFLDVENKFVLLQDFDVVFRN